MDRISDLVKALDHKGQGCPPYNFLPAPAFAFEPDMTVQEEEASVKEKYSPSEGI